MSNLEGASTADELEKVILPSITNEELDIPDDNSDEILKLAPALNFLAITKAAELIKDGIVDTPFEEMISLSKAFDCTILLKKEQRQVTKSCEDRSACLFLKLLTNEQRASGVIIASSGNTAVSFAFQGKRMGIHITVVLPKGTCYAIRRSCKKYGADVINWNGPLKAAIHQACTLSKEKGYHFIDSFDNPLHIAAVGTLGREILELISDVDAVIVPVRSGILLAGIALVIKSVKPSIQIIGVEYSKNSEFSSNLKAIRNDMAFPKASFTNKLESLEVSRHALKICAPLVDQVISVNSDLLALTVTKAFDIGCVMDPIGLVGISSLFSGELKNLSGKLIVICVQENILDLRSYSKYLERGMMLDGQITKLIVTVISTPNAIAELNEFIYKLGSSVVDISYNVQGTLGFTGKAKIQITCKTRDRDHGLELVEELSKRYEEVIHLSEAVNINRIPV